MPRGVYNRKKSKTTSSKKSKTVKSKFSKKKK